MKIALIDVGNIARCNMPHSNVFPNLAIAKICAYHKKIGDFVEWYDPLFGGIYDRIYLSKIFTFSRDYEEPLNGKEVFRGGTGYGIQTKLPPEIDGCQPDLSIYPIKEGVSFGFLTRGCPNRCPWCVVPKKEGQIRPYWDVDRVANGNKHIVLMDNNILASGEYTVSQLSKIIERGYVIDFNQAIDARLVTPLFAKLLSQIKWIHSRIRFGCDTVAQISHCERAIGLLQRNGFKGEIFLYMMIGGNSDFYESLTRINY